MKDVKGKKVLITGAAGGIGLCTAQKFAEAGSELILTDVNEESLRKAESALSAFTVPIHYRRVNVTDQGQVKDLAEWVIHDLGGLDILINNAGIGHQGELVDMTMEEWEKILKVNLLGPLYHIYAFLPHFKEKRSGHIVNIFSGQAFFRLTTWGAYASIKAAPGAFSEILYYELRKYHIKVTTVYPFMVNTPFYKDIQGETWGARLAMKLVPYYSMTPERVGKIIFKAVRKENKVEMVSILNDVGMISQVIPFANDIMSITSNLFLAKQAEASQTA